MKAVILVGVSGSGKSTYARELCKQGYKCLDRDDLRFSLTKAQSWDEYRFNRVLEQVITKTHEQLLSMFAFSGFNVVIAETNLSPKTRNAWYNRLVEAGYEVEFKPMHISFEEAVDRDANRQYSVGKEVIEKQWPRWVEYLNYLEEV